MAAYNTLFVSEEKIKSATSIHQSVSPADLQPYILQSQDLYLQNYLGSTFYQQLQTQINASTVTTANRYLLDNFIGPMLCNYALYHALPFLKYKIFNKSIMSANGETSNSIDLDELKFLQNEVRSVAENYTKLMQLYLKNNAVDYPAYVSPLLTDGMLPDKKTPYFSGLQTNSKYFNYKRNKNYPYGDGQRPSGSYGSSYNDGCIGCDDRQA